MTTFEQFGLLSYFLLAGLIPALSREFPSEIVLTLCIVWLGGIVLILGKVAMIFPWTGAFTLATYAGIGLLAFVGFASFSHTKSRSSAIAFMLGWILPGLGQVYIGRKRAGYIIMGCVLAAFLFGLFCTSWYTITINENPFYFFGHFGSFPAFVHSMLVTRRAEPNPNLPFVFYEIGQLYACVASLLGYVAALNALSPLQEVKELGTPSAPELTPRSAHVSGQSAGQDDSATVREPPKSEEAK